MQFVEDELRPYVKEVTATTADYYARILERIWQRRPPAPGRSTEKHLVDLGVDINDVWIVASAWEYNLTLLTGDGMAIIRDLVPEVSFESWIA